MRLSDLLGVRARILEATTTKRLSSADRRIVLFKGAPVGVIQRRPGSMHWYSPKRRVPFWSIDDAAVSIVADLFLAMNEGGPEAVRALIERAREEAGGMDAELSQQDLEDAIGG